MKVAIKLKSILISTKFSILLKKKQLIVNIIRK